MGGREGGGGREGAYPILVSGLLVHGCGVMSRLTDQASVLLVVWKRIHANFPEIELAVRGAERKSRCSPALLILGAFLGDLNKETNGLVVLVLPLHPLLEVLVLHCWVHFAPRAWLCRRLEHADSF